jgi:hypothetical protein
MMTPLHLYDVCMNTGREPRRLYNLTEFMICDKDGGGTMSEDECAEVIACTLLTWRFMPELKMILD